MWAGGFDQTFGEQRSGDVGEAEGGGVGNFAELFGYGGVDPGMIVAMEVGPNGGIGVEIFAAFSIGENRAFAGSDDDGRMLEPIAHLGEGMPDVFMVEFGGVTHVGWL